MGAVEVEIGEDGIGLVTVDNPPVNAAGHAVRAGLMEAVRQLEGRGARAAVLACAGRTFVAGADIREFGRPPQPPSLPEVVDAIEASRVPWVAAIHGAALGGGLELALGCAARIAVPGAKLGLPEVTLGIIPGAGGTVRLPRLVAVAEAVEMIAGGKPLAAPRALEIGLIDRLAEGDLLADARLLAAALATQPRPERLSARAPVDPPPPEAWDAARTRHARRARGQLSPVEAVEAVREAVTLPAEAAFAAERARFLRLRDDPQAAALRYIFFAEREVSRMPRLADAAPRPLDRIGVVGGGTMGAGIAAACLLRGLAVAMVERDAEALAAGLGRVAGLLDGARARGVIDAEARARLGAALEGGTDYGILGDADLVIEAVFEDMEVKRAVFAALDGATRPEAVLATNTSYLDVGEIARAVADPTRVLGLHFFSPAHVMKLLEVVHPPAVSDTALATGFALARRLGKIAVPAGVCDGFIGNRIMSAYRREADYMLEDGALPWEIDRAMRAFGFPMGLFEMQDLAGLDIAWAMRKRRAATRPASERYVEIPDRLCEAGRLGRKAGRGWYDYSEGPDKGAPDPEVEALILAESARKGIDRRPISGEAAMARILAVMQAEGRAILAEGIAASAEAIDVVMVNGYGFPRWRGGPMFMARG